MTISSSSDFYYPVCDANGNISDYVDGAGDIVVHFEYDAFGKVTGTTIAASLDSTDFAFRFSSKYEDIKTDLNYYGFRYYSSEMGCWINRDFIEERGCLNIYSMVGNSAINTYDILGLEKPNPAHDNCISHAFELDGSMNSPKAAAKRSGAKKTKCDKPCPEGQYKIYVYKNKFWSKDGDKEKSEYQYHAVRDDADGSGISQRPGCDQPERHEADDLTADMVNKNYCSLRLRQDKNVTGYDVDKKPTCYCKCPDAAEEEGAGGGDE
jgi:RHS repeat-associated protein